MCKTEGFDQSKIHFRITLEWEDGRYADKNIGFGKEGYYNEHRKIGCPSNHIPYDDTINLWRPNLQLLKALTVVILLPTILKVKDAILRQKFMFRMGTSKSQQGATM